MKLGRSFLLTLGIGLVAAAASWSAPGESGRYWVFFRDKGPPGLLKRSVEAVREELGERTLLRRSKVLPPEELVDGSDLPLWEPYLERLAEAGARVVVVSRWLNAASVAADSSALAEIERLPFVLRIQPVRRWLRSEPREEWQAPRVALRPEGLRYDYGLSYNQVAMLRVPELHAWGIQGGGIIVGLLDAGYEWRSHQALQRAMVLGEWDFIWNDPVTSDQAGQDYPGQAAHGTETFSVIAGFQPGSLIGPAFGAFFYLAKTERVTDLQGNDFEQPIEEDYWVAGLEWLERNGVDIVSTSLGYSDWYTPADMDGNTAVVTVAADLAVKKGVFVAASAGNMGNRVWRIVTAPADGDSVVAVGAVRPDGLIAGFSSHGPTADGRIKPDVVAQGVGVYVAAPGTSSGYLFAQGTSFSCPLVAGVAALVLSAHPELGPIQLREALRQTASQASHPDTLYGWGIVDAVEAALYFGPVFSNVPSIRILGDSRLEIRTYAVSKHGFVPGSLHLHYRVKGEPEQSVMMTPSDTSNQYLARIGPFPRGTEVRFWFTAVDSARGAVSFPRVFSDFFSYIVGQDRISPPWLEPPEEFALRGCFPNPFREWTRISFDLPDAARVTLQVYDVRGRLICSLLEGQIVPAGRHGFEWRAVDQDGRPVSPGVYLVRLRIEQREYHSKIVLVR
jgi:hypothetical protein